jgi:hypothetical protein
MKMPRRPFFPITLKPRPDIFGLHHVTLLEAARESEAERKKRYTAVETGTVAAFKAAMSHSGEDRARKLFQQVLRSPMRGTSKSVAPDRRPTIRKERMVA